jgi:hypothetical protein
MARLSDADKAALRELTARGWVQSPAERSPVLFDPTPEARERYCRWATAMARLRPTGKPPRFGGTQWKL